MVRKAETHPSRCWSPRASARGCGFPQVDEDPPELAQRIDRTAQVEAEIDGLHMGVMPLWEMLQRVAPARRISPLHDRPTASWPWCRPGDSRLRPCPTLRPAGHDVRQPVDLVDASVGVEGFETLDNPGMQSPALFLEEAAVDNLVCQGVLKGVHRLGKGLFLIEDLGVLEDTEVLIEALDSRPSGATRLAHRGR